MRAENSAKNAIVGIGSQGLVLILDFLVRTVFIYTLSEEFLGINGLFTSVLTILSLSELGVGSAIIYALYKPLAEKDEEKIRQLMELFRKAYRIIGCVVLLLGFILIPFLPYLVKAETNIVNLKFVYILFLLESVSSYWFFAYKSSLLNADQKSYVISIIRSIIQLFKAVARIVLLFLLNDFPIISFYVYTIIGLISNILINLFTARKVDKLYPYINIKSKNQLIKAEKKQIFKNVYALSINKISYVVNNATDNLIITAYVGLGAAGQYSNYALIVSSVTTVIGILFNSMLASIGNLNVTEQKDKKEDFLDCLQFLYTWIYGAVYVCMYCLLNPFIQLIWPENYLLSQYTVFIILLNFLTSGLLGAITNYREACGIYWQNRYRPLVSAIVNLGLSILFAKEFQWGIAGILLATVISRVVVVFPYDAHIIYKTLFNKKAYKYYIKYCMSLFFIVGIGVLSKYICDLMNFSEFIQCVWILMVSLIIPNVLCIVLCHRTKEFKYWYNAIKNILCKIKGKVRK